MPNVFVFRTRIRFIDTDASGRIHYTAMFRYFESAEIEFLRTLSITYDLDSGYSYPRVHVECDYHRALRHDDEIEIEVAVGHIGTSSVRLDFRTLLAGAPAAKGHITIVCLDKQTQRASPLPDAIRAKLVEAMPRA